MKKWYTLLLFFILVYTASAQYNWAVKTSGTTNDLNDVFFYDGNNGWAVGANGTIIHSSNGGETWASQSSGSTGNIYSVQFTSLTNGWATGDDGLLKTTNGGLTWTIANNGISGMKSGLCFVDAQTGWVTGGGIYKTTNGGTSWVMQDDNSWGTQIFFLDANHGWTPLTLHATTDGGTTWNDYTMNVPAMYDAIKSLWFVSANDGWLVDGDEFGGGRILKSSNGGLTWDQQTSGVNHFLRDVRFTNTTNGWMVGWNGTIISTSDAGSVWTSETSPTSNNLESVFMMSSGTGWAVGSNGTIIKRTVGEQICLVNVDASSQKYKINWVKTSGLGATNYKLYKETTPGNFALLATVPASQPGEYIDYSSNPTTMAASYKLSWVDAASTESDKSPYHKTSLLTVTQGVPSSTMTLLWNLYEDESGDFSPEYYYIYRGTSPANIQLHDSVTGAFAIYNDLNVFSVYYYQIGFKKDCGSAQNYVSMPVNNAFIGIGENNLYNRIITLFPNPAYTEINMDFTGSGEEEISLQIMDISGKVVITGAYNYPEELRFSTGLLPSGMYFVEAVGKYTYHGKFIVQ